MKFLRNISGSSPALVLADQAIYSGSNFLLTFLLARQFSTLDFGIYSYLLLFTYLLLSVSTAIIIQPYQTIIAQKQVDKALGVITKIMAAYFISVLFFLCFFYFFLTINGLPFSFLKFNLKDISAVFPSALCFVLSYLLQDFFRKSLLAIQKTDWVIAIDLLFLGVFPVLIFNELKFQESLYAMAFFNGASSLFGIIFFLKNAQFKTRDSSYFQYHYQHGKWLLSTAALQWFSNNFLVFVSGLYLGLQALGAFRLVQSFFGILNIMLQTAENFFLPKTAKLYYSNKLEASRYVSNVRKWGMLIFGVVLLVLFIFSNQIIVILGGEKYRDFGYVVKLMAILYCFIFYGYTSRIAVRILGLNRAFFVGYAISFVFSILSFHLLLKYAGLYGAVTGLVISQVLMITYWKQQLRLKNFNLWK